MSIPYPNYITGLNSDAPSRIILQTLWQMMKPESDRLTGSQDCFAHAPMSFREFVNSVEP